MKYLYVVNESLMFKLVAHGYRMLHQYFDIEQKPIWVFEYDPSNSFCFDINDTSFRGAYAVSDKFTMRF